MLVEILRAIFQNKYEFFRDYLMSLNKEYILVKNTNEKNLLHRGLQQVNKKWV